MPALFSFKVRGMEELQAFFKSLPLRARGIAAEATSDDLIGDGSRGLKRYPPYKYIHRSSVYRPTFKSERQRRFVMAGIRSGRIDPGYPHRTGTYQRSWQRTGSGVGSRIQGELPHAGWPDKLAKRIGWRESMEIIKSNLAHAVRHAESVISKYFKSKGY
jgi:hypothetical protein